MLVDVAAAHCRGALRGRAVSGAVKSVLTCMGAWLCSVCGLRFMPLPTHRMLQQPRQPLKAGALACSLCWTCSTPHLPHRSNTALDGCIAVCALLWLQGALTAWPAYGSLACRPGSCTAPCSTASTPRWVPQGSSTTGLQHRRAPAPQGPSTTGPQHRRVPAPQGPSTTRPQHHSTAGSQHRRAPAPQGSSTAGPQHHRAPALQGSSTTGLQHRRAPALQGSSTTGLQHHRAPAPQGSSTTGPWLCTTPASPGSDTARPDLRMTPPPSGSDTARPQLCATPAPPGSSTAGCLGALMFLCAAAPIAPGALSACKQQGMPHAAHGCTWGGGGHVFHEALHCGPP